MRGVGDSGESGQCNKAWMLTRCCHRAVSIETAIALRGAGVAAARAPRPCCVRFNALALSAKRMKNEPRQHLAADDERLLNRDREQRSIAGKCSDPPIRLIPRHTS